MPQNTEIRISISRTMPFQDSYLRVPTHECSSTHTGFHQEDPVVWQSRMEPQPTKLLPAEQELMHERLHVQPQKLYAELMKNKSLESVCINNSPLQRVHAIVALLFLLSCMLADRLELFASCEVLKKNVLSSVGCSRVSPTSHENFSSLIMCGKSESFPKTRW